VFCCRHRRELADKEAPEGLKLATFVGGLVNPNRGEEGRANVAASLLGVRMCELAPKQTPEGLKLATFGGG
jgi:hypothetical protein